MLKRLLQRKYGIQTENEFTIEGYEACENQQSVYMLFPVGSIEQETILELEQLANHLVKFGDKAVCQFLKTKEDESIVNWENNRYCVLMTKEKSDKRIEKLGRKLAKFHYRGRAVPFKVNRISRIGMWKTFWEQRLDQMEKVWNEQLFHPPENDFERIFLETFPYYMGIAENAIQYLTDTELDDEPQLMDSGTVCHERFSQFTWGENHMMKNPFHWVFDHAARDLAEWTRERYFRNIKTYEPELEKFYHDYMSVSPLSSFSWRLLYARLVFPLHYFECVEEYYITSSEQQRLILEERLKKMTHQSAEYEQFLGNFFQLVRVPVRRYRIPQLDWLSR